MMTVIIKKLTLLTVFLISISITSSAMKIVSSGTGNACISHGIKASPTELYACKELQSAIKKISGVNLQIGNNSSPYKIIVGTPESNTDIAENIKKLGLDKGDPEKTAVYTIGNKLYLAGKTPRGALYAVYDFLEKQLGVKWLWPGEAGEFMPSMKTITVNDLQQNSEPGFKYRGFHICFNNHHDLEMENWMLRNRMNILRCSANSPFIKERKDKGYIIMVSNHLDLPKELFKREPNIFAMANNKRHIKQLCYSNPHTVEVIAKRFLSWWKKNKEIEIINIYPPDNMYYCECPECVKREVSDIWFDFLGRVLNVVDKHYPNGKYATIAYQGYKKVPRVKLPRLEFVEYCLYNECYRHGPECPNNIEAIKDISNWQRKGVPVVIYGYEYDIFMDNSSTAQEKMIFEMTREFKKMNLSGEITEVGFGWDKQDGRNARRLSRYIQARMLWKPQQKFSDLIDEWTTVIYGQAAKHMKKFHALQQAAWSRSKNHLGGCSHNSSGFAGDYINWQEFSILNKYLKDAKNAATGDPRALTQISIEKRMLNAWEKRYLDWKEASNRNTIIVPYSKEKFAKLPTFTGKGKIYPTKVKMNYDRETFCIECECIDPAIEKLTAHHKEKDSEVWADECLELFIITPKDREKHQYSHLAINSDGVKYDAKCHGSMQFDIGWNPDWTASVSKGTNSWKVKIKLPFESFGTSKKNWSIGINRSHGQRDDYENSGFPTGSYHDINSLANIHFKTVGERLNAVYFSSKKNVSDIIIQGRKQKLAIQPAYNINTLNTLLLNRPQVLIADLNDERISNKYILEKLIPFIQKGGITIFYGDGIVKQAIYGKSEEPKWSGYKAARLRKNMFSPDNLWSSKPNNISASLQEYPSPMSGYLLGKNSGWEKLAELEIDNGKKAAWLFRRPLGKGYIYVTSCGMGLSGGFAVFGNAQVVQLCKFIQNICFK